MRPDPRRPPYEADSFTRRDDLYGGDRTTEYRKPSHGDVFKRLQYPCHCHILPEQLCRSATGFAVCALRQNRVPQRANFPRRARAVAYLMG